MSCTWYVFTPIKHEYDTHDTERGATYPHPVKLEVPDEVARLREWVAIKDERIKLLEDRLRQRTDVPLTS